MKKVLIVYYLNSFGEEYVWVYLISKFGYYIDKGNECWDGEDY